MANEVVATFPKPLDSFSINLRIENNTTTTVRAFGLSGRTAKFPITWDSTGSFSGSATITGITGLDTEVVFIRFSGFGQGETVSFSGIDPDFTGDVSSGVRVIDIVGSRSIVLFGDGSTGFGEYEVNGNGDLVAIIQ